MRTVRVRIPSIIRLLAAAPILIILALGSVVSAGEARVEVERGLVSASFDAVPVREALEAVRRGSGVEIVAPASVQDRTLTMTVEREPFEEFLRRLLHRLELGGFALVYESGGAAQRVIVVDRARGGAAAPEPVPPHPAPTGSRPVYIPPATPPVYIPPATPPAYIPPATPPVYVPPATGQ
jgi:hypothetical protein